MMVYGTMAQTKKILKVYIYIYQLKEINEVSP